MRAPALVLLLASGSHAAQITVEAGGSVILESGGAVGNCGGDSCIDQEARSKIASLEATVQSLQATLARVTSSVVLPPAPPAPPLSPTPPALPAIGAMAPSEMQTFPHAGIGICSTSFGGCMQNGVNAGQLHSSWNRDVDTMKTDGKAHFSGHSYHARPNYLGFDLSAHYPDGVILDAVGVSMHYNVQFSFVVQASNTPGAWDLSSETFPEDEVWVTLSESFNGRPDVANAEAIGDVDLTSKGFVKTSFPNETPYLKYRIKIESGPWAAFGWTWSGGVPDGPPNPWDAAA